MSSAGTAVKSVSMEGERESGAATRRGGRNFMVAFYAALRAIKLYPLEHSAVQKTVAELTQVACEVLTHDGLTPGQVQRGALRVLRQQGWVSSTRVGRLVSYRLEDEIVHDLLHRIGARHG